MDRAASGGASPAPQRRSDSASRRLANLAPGTERRVSGETVPALTGWGGPGCALPRGRGPRLETLVEPTAFRGSLDLGNAPLFPAAKDTRPPGPPACARLGSCGVNAPPTRGNAARGGAGRSPGELEAGCAGADVGGEGR